MNFEETGNEAPRSSVTNTITDFFDNSIRNSNITQERRLDGDEAYGLTSLQELVLRRRVEELRKATLRVSVITRIVISVRSRSVKKKHFCGEKEVELEGLFNKFCSSEHRSEASIIKFEESSLKMRKRTDWLPVDPMSNSQVHRKVINVSGEVT